MRISHIASIISDLSMSTWHLKVEVNVNVHTGAEVNLLSKHTDQIYRSLETKHWTQYLQLSDRHRLRRISVSINANSPYSTSSTEKWNRNISQGEKQNLIFSVTNNISATINPDLEALASIKFYIKLIIFSAVHTLHNKCQNICI